MEFIVLFKSFGYTTIEGYYIHHFSKYNNVREMIRFPEEKLTEGLKALEKDGKLEIIKGGEDLDKKVDYRIKELTGQVVEEEEPTKQPDGEGTGEDTGEDGGDSSEGEEDLQDGTGETEQTIPENNGVEEVETDVKEDTKDTVDTPEDEERVTEETTTEQVTEETTDEEVEAKYTREQLEEENVSDLKDICRDENLSGYSSLRKDELIDLILGE